MTISIPIREPADFKFTVRQSNWDGGYNRLYYQQINTLTEPRFWDSFNAEVGIEGEIDLAPLFEQVHVDGSDKQPKLVEFNGYIYKLEGVVTPAIYKSSDGISWSSVTMGGSAPSTAITSATVWRNYLWMTTVGANNYFRLDTSDVWYASTSAPSGITQVADCVGVAPDDKLLIWYNSKGLYQNANTTPSGVGDYSKVWPTSTDPDEATCDLLSSVSGTTIIVTRDSKGSSLHEYFTAEGAATAASVVTWIQERDTFFYSAAFYNQATYLGAKKGQGGGLVGSGQGLLWRKERGLKPVMVQEFGDGIRGAIASRDFGIRALANDGDTLWIGAPSRAANFSGTVGIPCVYRYEVDEQGVESISPNSAIDSAPGNVAGTVYSAAFIGGDIVIATSTGIWKRNHNKHAASGYLESSIYDLRSPDHVKSWRFAEILLETATSTEYVKFYYRAGTLSGTWLGGTQITAAGAKKISFPDDNPALKQYKYNTRQIQTRAEFYRGTDSTLQPRLTSLAIDAAQIKPVGYE